MATAAVRKTRKALEVEEVELPASKNKKIYLTYEDYDPEDLYLYAGLDCIVTSKLFASIIGELEDNPEYLVSNVVGRPTTSYAKSILDTNDEVTKIAFEYILDMEINGLKYDIEKNRKLFALIQADIAALDKEIFKTAPAGLNLDSGKEVTQFLYGDLGLVPPSFTKTNEPSTDGEALLVLAGLDPLNPKDYVTPDPSKQFLAYMAKRKDLNSTCNTFVKTYVQDFVKRDGRIHPSYNLHGTSGFRISGDSPNLTQLPRPKHGYNLRDLYVVEEGTVFIAFDFSSAEVKILGALCKDPAMLKAIADELDFHSFSASSMLGVTYDAFMKVLGDKADTLYKEYKNYRQIAKVLTFSILL